LPGNTNEAQLKLTNKSPLAKYLSVMANPITRGMASRNFIFPLDSGANFLEQNRKATFHYPDEIPESRNTFIWNSPRRLCRAEPPRSQTFRNFGSFFPPVTNAASRYPTHIPADTDWTRQVAVDTKHCMRSVCGQCTRTVRRHCI